MDAKGFAWFVVKWLVVPAGMAAIGYFLIGPRLGDMPGLKSASKSTAVEPSQPQVVPQAYSEYSQSKSEEPKYADMKIDLTEPGKVKKKEESSAENEPERPSDKLRDSDEPVPDGAPDTDSDGKKLPDTPPSTGDGWW